MTVQQSVGLPHKWLLLCVCSEISSVYPSRCHKVLNAVLNQMGIVCKKQIETLKMIHLCESDTNLHCNRPLLTFPLEFPCIVLSQSGHSQPPYYLFSVWKNERISYDLFILASTKH